MADTSPEKPDAAAPVVGSEDVPESGAKVAGEGELAAKAADKPEGDAVMEEAKDAEVEPKAPENAETTDEAAAAKPAEDEKKTDDDGDAEMKDAADTAAEPEADATAATAAAVETSGAKNKSRRKSTAGESKGKTLSKKGSKARLTHIDAQPGDHFLVKLKGFPAWPAIICDEDMLPQALINTRPVSAARPDGTYSEAYADGGKRVNDRSFPVMYLSTNEFGWVTNTALSELSAEKARESIGDKMRKDLKLAFELAAEQNPLEHYKDILQSFQDELIAQEEAKKEAAATPKKSKKGKAKASDDEDVDMDDVDEAPKPKAKKRKASEEDAAVPQRSDSVKKPKIKLNTSSSSKAANGTAAPKAKEDKAAKVAKAKPKKGADKKEAPKEAKLTPEERHARKEKEILYLRHKLQRGLLTREQQPREDEMKSMSSFIDILEKNFDDLEVSIIKSTKINKVFKAILKLDSIPREEEFHFKKRSQALLDKWNKLLSTESAPANGVNGASEAKDSGKPAEESGAKESGDKDKEAEDEKPKETAEEPAAAAPAKDEETEKKEDVSLEKDEKAEKAETEAAPVSAAVEATA